MREQAPAFERRPSTEKAPASRLHSKRFAQCGTLLKMLRCVGAGRSEANQALQRPFLPEDCAGAECDAEGAEGAEGADGAERVSKEGALAGTEYTGAE